MTNPSRLCRPQSETLHVRSGIESPLNHSYPCGQGHRTGGTSCGNRWPKMEKLQYTHAELECIIERKRKLCLAIGICFEALLCSNPPGRAQQPSGKCLSLLFSSPSSSALSPWRSRRRRPASWRTLPHHASLRCISRRPRIYPVVLITGGVSPRQNTHL